MGFSETDSSICRRHPNHKQSPGVCSSCLREKLCKLTLSPSNNKTSSYVASGSSSFSSTPSSTGTRKSSGSSHHHHHRRNGSETYVSVGMMLNNGLKKSRSVSCAPLSSSRTKLGAASNTNTNAAVINEKLKECVNGEVDNNNNNNNTKKKNGFLKKLIHTTGKKTKGVLMQSKTMRERSSSSSSSSSIPIPSAKQ